jgi:hypothetical protein
MMENKKAEETKGSYNISRFCFRQIMIHFTFSGKFVAIPSGGPASRGAGVADDEDGGNGYSEQYTNILTKVMKVCADCTDNHLLAWNITACSQLTGRLAWALQSVRR